MSYEIDEIDDMMKNVELNNSINNSSLNNITNSFNSLSVNNETFENITTGLDINGNIITDDNMLTEEDYEKEKKIRKEVGMYGIPNRFCSNVDDEDFVYKTLILPRSIFNELNESIPFTNEEFGGYEEYFSMFCQNNDETFLTTDNIFGIAKIFDTMFDKKIINYDFCYEVINQTLAELNEFEQDNNYNQYFDDTIKEYLYGLRIIITKLTYLIEHYNNWYSNEILKLLNNYCVICIYLKFYFETNIFIDNNDNIIFS